MLRVGDVVPAIELESSDGHRELLVARARPTLLFFYRGKWCPFCNTYLRSMTELAPRLLAAGDVRAVTSEDSAALQVMVQRHRPPFPLLSDPTFAAIDAFGIRHPGGGPGGSDITRPAICVADRSGRLSYVYVGKSPIDRPLPEAVLTELERAAGLRTQGHQPLPLERVRAVGSLLAGAARGAVRGYRPAEP